MKNSEMIWLGFFTLVLLCCLGLVPLRAEEAQEASGAKTQKVTKGGKSDERRVQIARMRGKLLYQRSQIRKLEKAVCQKDAAVRGKIEALEQERRAQFEAAEPKLKELYAEADVLEEEIDRLGTTP